MLLHGLIKPCSNRPDDHHQRTGYLGGNSTFSTASFETIHLLEERRWKVGLANCLGTLVTARTTG